jgi:8-oxo-dGTP pyrophosphatase MutT (NUDIX family)
MVGSMAIPDFIVELRSRVGHAPLTLPAVTAVVFDPFGRVLHVRRADDGRWTLVTGCLEPGEQPAVGAVREVLEETAVEAVVERLVGVEALDLAVLPNGDQVWWLDMAFRCRAVGGEARVNDDESVEVAWFAPGEGPKLDARQARCLELAVAGGEQAWFRAAVPDSPGSQH